jgi:hypothetical protein
MEQVFQGWVQHFLSLHQDAAAGAQLLALHAPDAYVTFAGKPCVAASVDVDAFAEAHRQACEKVMTGGSALPDVRERVGAVVWQAVPPERGVLAVEVLSDGQLPAFWLTFGLLQVEQQWRVLWLALEPEWTERSFALGGAAALAELAFLPSQVNLPVRSWLDVAYRRQFNFVRVPLQTLPDQRFSCHGTGSCCQIYWEISAPVEAQALIDQMPWAELGADHLVGHQLAPHSDGRVYVKKGGERCAFLDENTRCRIHSALGTPVFDACVAFPFRFAEIPDGVAVATSYHCHSVRGNFGLPLVERQEDIWRRLNQVGLMITPRSGHALTLGRPVPWEAFQATEAHLLELLANPSIPLFQRLWVAARSLEAGVKDEEQKIEKYRQESPPPLIEGERAVADMLVPFWLGCVGKLRPTLSGLDGASIKSREPRNPEQVSRWLRNMLFSKDLSYQFDLVSAFSGAVILYLAVVALDDLSEGEIPEAIWADLGTVAAHNRVGAMFERLFSSAEYLRTEIADPHTPVRYLTWLWEKTQNTSIV